MSLEQLLNRLGFDGLNLDDALHHYESLSDGEVDNEGLIEQLADDVVKCLKAYAEQQQRIDSGIFITFDVGSEMVDMRIFGHSATIHHSVGYRGCRCVAPEPHMMNSEVLGVLAAQKLYPAVHHVYMGVETYYGLHGAMPTVETAWADLPEEDVDELLEAIDL